MSRALLKLLVTCVLMIPRPALSVDISGTLNSFSVRDRVLVVDNIEYIADLENLSITYDGEYVGIEALAAGIRVQLVINDSVSGNRDEYVQRLRILTRNRALES